MFGVLNEKELYIYKERHTSSPKWCVSALKMAEETEVDQEERAQPDTHDDGTNLKRLTPWSRGRPFV